MDRGARVEFSIGDTEGKYIEDHVVNGEVIELGKNVDLIDVDSLTLRGELLINLSIRPEGLSLSAGESRCFPLIRYSKVGVNDLRNIKLSQTSFTSADHPDIKSTYRLSLSVDTSAHLVSVCVTTDIIVPMVMRVFLPKVDGVSRYRPEYGTHWVTMNNGFSFGLTFSTSYPLRVSTNRVVGGVYEGEIFGTLNENGEYEYLLRNIRQDVTISIGPGYASRPLGFMDFDIVGVAVWSHTDMLYIRVPGDDVASIYSIAGHLIRRLALSTGTTSLPLSPSTQ